MIVTTNLSSGEQMTKIGVIILFLCCLSCRSRNENVSKDKFLILDSGKSKLLSAMTSPQIRVCLQSTSPEISAASWLPSAEQAVTAWIEPLRTITVAKLTTDIQIVIKDDCELDAFDHVIKLHPGNTRSSHAPGAGSSVTSFYVGDKRGYAVLLHETGHAVGLGDTYLDSGGKCQPGQPPSVMCNCDFFALQRDDVIGARVLFATYYSALLKPEIRKNIEEKGFRDFTKRWLYRSDEEKSLESAYKEIIQKLSELDEQIGLKSRNAAPALAALLEKRRSELSSLEQNSHDFGTPYFRLNQLADRISQMKSEDFTTAQISKRLGVAESVVAQPKTFLTAEEHESIRQSELLIAAKTEEIRVAATQLKSAINKEITPYNIKKTALEVEMRTIESKLNAFNIPRNELYNRWLKTATEIFGAL